MKINKKEFHDCTRKLIKDPTLQKIETENFIFLRPNGTITVKFKKLDRLTGYFSFDEIKNWKTLKIILTTLERELEKHNG